MQNFRRCTAQGRVFYLDPFIDPKKVRGDIVLSVTIVRVGSNWLLFPLIFISPMALGIRISNFILRHHRDRLEKTLLPDRYESTTAGSSVP